MNKAYLLAICLLLTPLTGCLDDFTKEELEITTVEVKRISGIIYISQIPNIH